MKNKAFTLIELFVVIVIIGILATISTATFGGARSKALISKYRLERIQAAKERYEECLSINNERECFPRTIVYRHASGFLYKKSADDTGDGIAITTRLVHGRTGSIAFSPDGKWVIYAGDDEMLYKKSINDNSNGILLTSFGYGYAPSYSPDGKYIVYTNLDDELIYKKNANDNSDGVPITSAEGNFAQHSPLGK